MNGYTSSDQSVISSTGSPDQPTASSVVARRADATIHDLIGQYMAVYAGQDPSRVQRLAWWDREIGHLTLDFISDDIIFFSLDRLSQHSARYWCGKDADGNAIYKAKARPLRPASINRYAAALSAVFTWAIKRRVAPRGWDNPCHRPERRPENNEVVRFLSDQERKDLLQECRASKWPKLYLLVMLALTTGARRGELERLRWRDVDLEARVCRVEKTKNGDPKLLPVVPTRPDPGFSPGWR